MNIGKRKKEISFQEKQDRQENLMNRWWSSHLIKRKKKTLGGKKRNSDVKYWDKNLKFWVLFIKNTNKIFKESPYLSKKLYYEGNELMNV